MKKIFVGVVFVFALFVAALGVSAESSESFTVEKVQFYDNEFNECAVINENVQKLAVSYSAMDFSSDGGYAYVIMCVKDTDGKIAEVSLKKVYFNPGVHFSDCVFDIDSKLENNTRVELYFIERGCAKPFADSKVYIFGRSGTYTYNKSYEAIDLYSSDIDFESSDFSNKLYYYASSRKMNVKMSADTKMYLNFAENETTIDVLKSLPENEFATVKLIDKNSDGIYDALYAVAYKYTVARKDVSDNGVIFTKRNDYIDLDLIGALKNSSNEIVNPKNVKMYDVLAVAYEDYTDTSSDIISAFTVDVPKISGEAESFSETDGKITINSKEYNILPYDFKLGIDYPYEGKDFYGYFLRGKSGEIIGCIEREEYDDNSAFILSADDTSMTFITNKGNIETHNYADEIYFENLYDTTRYSGSVNISSAYSYTGRNIFQNTCFEDYIPAGAVVKDVFASLYAKNKIITDETKEDEAELRVIKYSLDKSGNIKTIVPNTTRESAFRGIVRTMKFDAVNKKFYGSYISEKIAVFDINWADFEKSKVLGYDFFEDGYIYSGVLTDYDDSGDKATFVKLSEGVKSESDICDAAVVKKVKKVTLNGQDAYRISTVFNNRNADFILSQNDMHQVTTNVSTSQINVGTIIYIKTDCDYNLLSYSVIGQVENDLKFTFNSDFKNGFAGGNESYYLGVLKNYGTGYLTIDPIESVNGMSKTSFDRIKNMTKEVLYQNDYDSGKLKAYIGDAVESIYSYDDENYLVLIRTTDDDYFDSSMISDIFVFDKCYTNAQIEAIKAAANK